MKIAIIGTGISGLVSAWLLQGDHEVTVFVRERLTHENLKTNPFAVYLFMEDAPGHEGIRLYLKKVREEDDPELIRSMTRRHLTPEQDAHKGPKHLAVFTVEQVLPLIGSGEPPAR